MLWDSRNFTLSMGGASAAAQHPLDEGSQVVHCITKRNDIGSMGVLRLSSISLLDGSNRITREEWTRLRLLLGRQIGHKIPAIGWSSCATLLSSSLVSSSLPTRYKSVKIVCIWGEWRSVLLFPSSRFMIYINHLYTQHGATIKSTCGSAKSYTSTYACVCVCESDIKEVSSRHLPTHPHTHAGCCDVGRNLLCVMFPLSLDA